MIKTTCFFFNVNEKICNALKVLDCKNCKFYKHRLSEREKNLQLKYQEEVIKNINKGLDMRK